MQEIYFSGYSDLDRIPGVGKVAGILNDENYYNLTRAPLVYDKNYELKLERMAGVITTGFLKSEADVLKLRQHVKRFLKNIRMTGNLLFLNYLQKK